MTKQPQPITRQQREILTEVEEFFRRGSIASFVETINDLTHAWVTTETEELERPDMGIGGNDNQLYRANAIVNLLCKLAELNYRSQIPPINHE